MHSPFFVHCEACQSSIPHISKAVYGGGKLPQYVICCVFDGWVFGERCGSPFVCVLVPNDIQYPTVFQCCEERAQHVVFDCRSICFVPCLGLGGGVCYGGWIVFCLGGGCCDGIQDMPFFEVYGSSAVDVGMMIPFVCLVLYLT